MEMILAFIVLIGVSLVIGQVLRIAERDRAKREEAKHD